MVGDKTMKIRELEGTQEELIAYMEWLEAHEKQPTRGLKDRDILTTIIPKPTKLPNLPSKIDGTTIIPNDALFQSLGLQAKPQTIPPTRAPPKERTAKLEAIFGDYLKAGFDAKTIQEHLIKEHDISMSGHQVAGWMGRMRQQEKRMWAKCDDDLPTLTLLPSAEPRGVLSEGHEKPKEAAKVRDDISLPSEGQTTVKGQMVQPREAREELLNVAHAAMVTTKKDKSEDKASPVDATILKMYQAGNMDIDIKYKLDRMGHPMKVSEIRKRIDELKMGQVKA